MIPKNLRKILLGKLIEMRGCCQKCSSKDKLCIYFKDDNEDNFKARNLKLLCEKCCMYAYIHPKKQEIKSYISPDRPKKIPMIGDQPDILAMQHDREQLEERTGKKHKETQEEKMMRKVVEDAFYS